MSIDATRWAWEQKVKPTCKLVLLSLADRAGETHQAWPSVSRIEADTGLDRKTIMSAISELEGKALLSVSRALGVGNQYQLIGVSGRHETSTKNGTPTSPKIGTSPKNGTSTKNGTPTSTKNGTLNLPIEPTNININDAHAKKQFLEKNSTPQTDSLDGSPKSDKRSAKNPVVKIKRDWQPDDRCFELIARAGIPRDFAEGLIDEFIFYWEERGIKRSCWGTTFLNKAKREWGREIEKQKNQGGQPGHGAGSGYSRTNGASYDTSNTGFKAGKLSLAERAARDCAIAEQLEQQQRADDARVIG